MSQRQQRLHSGLDRPREPETVLPVKTVCPGTARDGAAAGRRVRLGTARQVTRERPSVASLTPRGRQAPAPPSCGLGAPSGSQGRALCRAGRRGRPGRRDAGRGGRGTGGGAAGRDGWPRTPHRWVSEQAATQASNGGGNSAFCPCPPHSRPSHRPKCHSASLGSSSRSIRRGGGGQSKPPTPYP